MARETASSGGWGYRFTHDSVIDAPALGFFPAVLNQNLYSAFVQDEIALRSNVSFTAGTKLEHNDYTGFEFEPSVRLSWILDPSQAVWGRRVPGCPHSFAHRSRSFRGGSSVSGAAAGRVQLRLRDGDRLRTGLPRAAQFQATASVSSFYNPYDHVRSTSYTPATIIPLFFSNNLEGDTYGLEFSGNYQVSDPWSVHAGYTLLMEHLRVKPGEIDLNDALNETADPEHQFSLRSSLNLPHRLEWDAALRWVDTLRTNSGPMPERCRAISN